MYDKYAVFLTTVAILRTRFNQ